MHPVKQEDTDDQHSRQKDMDKLCYEVVDKYEMAAGQVALAIKIKPPPI
jgi:hypothetical protein